MNDEHCDKRGAPHHWTGLTPAEVEASRNAHGPNLLTPPKRTPWWLLYLEKFKDPIIRILIIAAVTALAIGLKDGHYIEGIGIIAAILLSTGLSFANEYRAAREFDVLNQVSDDEEFEAIRDGLHTLVPKRDLVVGDIILIAQGTDMPADAEVLDAISFSVNESSLTGESLPAEKIPAPGGPPANSGHSYPTNMAYRGTVVADGHAVLRVTAVGDATEIGKTARAASETPDTVTPLTRQLDRLARLIGVGAFSAAAVIFVALSVKGWFKGDIGDVIAGAATAVKIPLSFGQWYAFALLAAVLLILGAQIWLPVVEDAMDFLVKGGKHRLSAFLAGRTGFVQLLATAGFLALVGLLVGFAFGWISGSPDEWFPMPAVSAFLGYFMVAVTVIVVAVPEGLPMCVTLALAYSMRKMTATNNLVRKMHACETIGAATVICSDKTGTLTMNEMRVDSAVFSALPDGGLTETAAGERIAEAAAVNSTANLDESSGQPKAIGNPTEGALILWLKAQGKDYEELRLAFALRRQLAFSTDRKFMATAGLSGRDGQPVLYVKGAPEIVLGFCRFFDEGKALDNSQRDFILREAAKFQGRGMRIIGMAHRNVDMAFLDEEIDPEPRDLCWDGFFAISDPIRPEVPGAVRTAMDAGIKVKIVTGDNQVTAREIARQSGLWQPDDGDDRMLTGDAFMDLPDADAGEAAARLKVMSRARPLNKLRLVKLLQGGGEVVAVTGDGTNDAPALNHADVGLAMGKTGTAVAKEAADIILLDDSFTSIVNAVCWGRSLYANIQKFIVFQLTINVAAVGIALLGPFLGVSLPLTVIQMLWVNLIMDTFAALALASEPPDWKLMGNPPRRSDAFIITPGMKTFILGTGFFFLLLFVTLILGFSDVFPMDGGSYASRHNQTIFFTAFVMLQFWNLFNARAFGSTRSALSRLGQSKGFLAMVGVILAGQMLLVELGGNMFRVTSLSASEWLAITVFTSPVLWFGELLRWRKRRGSMPAEP